MSQENKNILECQTKKVKKEKKNSKLLFVKTRRNIHSFGNAKQHNLLFNYSFFKISVMVLYRWKKIGFSVVKFNWKVNIPKAKR